MTLAELTGQCLIATSILVLAWVLNEVKKELRTWSNVFANGVNAVNGTACNLTADFTHTIAKEVRGIKLRSRSRYVSDRAALPGLVGDRRGPALHVV